MCTEVFLLKNYPEFFKCINKFHSILTHLKIFLNFKMLFTSCQLSAESLKGLSTCNPLIMQNIKKYSKDFLNLLHNK